MKTKATLLFTGLFLSVLNFTNAQAIIENDTVYYPEIHTIDYDQVVYKTAAQIDELTIPATENLALRVYYPTDLAPEEKRPLVVLIHGGGFIAGSYVSFFSQAEALAQLGYVAVSVQYRLCKRGDCLLAAGLSYPCNVAWSNSLVPSAYAAAVDVSDAISWLELHAEEYHIDTENIVVGGHSAGAWTSLLLAFTDADEIEEVCGSCGTWPDYLEGEINPPSGLKGVLNMSGAVLDTLWIDEDESDIAIMSIHGTHDGVVHYGSEPVYPCCNTYTVPVQGSCPITQRHTNLDGNTYLLTGANHGHDVFTNDWWPDNQLQILWFLGQSFFGDQAFNIHTEIQRPIPVETCPPPFASIPSASLCNIPFTGLKTVLFDYVSAIETVETGSEVKIYPNPATAKVVIDLGKKASKSQIRVWDMLGQLVLITTIDGNQQELDISNFQPGVYWLEARSGVYRLVVQ